MRVVVAGGTGFLGSALVTRVRADGHDVVVLTRTPREPGQVAWNPHEPGGSWVAALAAADAVINLAGESIDAQRWTAARKRTILESRIVATRAIVSAMAAHSGRILLNASAVGVYGPHGDEIVTEESPPGSDVLASVCVAWEAEARRAAPEARVVLLRTGLVLDRHGGALPRLVLPFRCFIGGPLGSGRQYWSWVHLDDWLDLVMWALTDERVAGPLNLTAPTPVPSYEFARAVGRALRRPSLFPAPAWALRLALGEMADALILSGQRVVPSRADSLGFSFRFPELSGALAAIYGTASPSVR